MVPLGFLGDATVVELAKGVDKTCLLGNPHLGRKRASGAEQPVTRGAMALQTACVHKARIMSAKMMCGRGVKLTLKHGPKIIRQSGEGGKRRKRKEKRKKEKGFLPLRQRSVWNTHCTHP
jgi:hypothetical protein